MLYYNVEKITIFTKGKCTVLKSRAKIEFFDSLILNSLRMNITKSVSKTTMAAGLLLIMIAASSTPGMAQLSEYERLAFRNNSPRVFVNVFTLPGESADELKLTTVFNLSYNFLPFKKLNNSQRKEGYFSSASLNIEVFESPEKGLERDEQVDIEGLEPVGRAAWKDTAYATTYEATKSNAQGLIGSMQVDVSPGYYTYLLQLSQQDQQQKRNSRTQNIRVMAYNNQERDNIILGKAVDDDEIPSQMTLFTKGNNVTFAKDFYALIPLSNTDDINNYSLSIDRLNVDEEDTTVTGQVFESNIPEGTIIQNIHPQLQQSGNNLLLSLDKENDAYTYALIHIPNSKFPNALYRIQVKSGESTVVAETVFQSYWSDIPTSLLSLDIAIDMLRFMADKETVNRIDRGSDTERERKFREFWEKRDPTPDTEFNELQAEYYRRIDYAYENFGSQNTLGFNSDRGKVYINYGPPNDINRTFPTDGATTEVWTYNNRKFVFKATSGFGDFKLVSQ